MAAPKENKNAEKWSLEVATDFMNKAVELSTKNKYDFIGEVAKDLDSYIDVFDYLADKFTELKHLKLVIKRNCEVNCFSNGKKGDINTAMAIVNLKSNHGWTDRQESNVNVKGEVLNYTPEELDKRINELLNKKDAD